MYRDEFDSPLEVGGQSWRRIPAVFEKIDFSQRFRETQADVDRWMYAWVCFIFYGIEYGLVKMAENVALSWLDVLVAFSLRDTCAAGDEGMSIDRIQ